MPFTASHAVVAAPFRGSRIPISAVAIGAMMPDLPYFLPPLQLSSAESHTFAGAVSIDVVYGLLCFVVWHAIIAPAALAAAPRKIRARIGWMGLRSMSTMRGLALTVAGIAFGSLTHVFWDGFTHSAGWAVLQLPSLTTQFGPLPGFRWLQHLSTAVGAVGIAWAIRSWLREDPAPSPSPNALPPEEPGLILAFGASAAIGFIVGLGKAMSVIAGFQDVRSGLIASVIYAITYAAFTAGVLIIGTAGLWHLRTRMAWFAPGIGASRDQLPS